MTRILAAALALTVTASAASAGGIPTFSTMIPNLTFPEAPTTQGSTSSVTVLPNVTGE
ncbi:MAG: hypothetical protein AAFO93_03215 [Pseudomonadota bacterium]